MNWQKFERFSQKINERILRQWQQTYLEKLRCLRCNRSRFSKHYYGRKSYILSKFHKIERFQLILTIICRLRKVKQSWNALQLSSLVFGLRWAQRKKPCFVSIRLPVKVFKTLNGRQYWGGRKAWCGFAEILILSCGIKVLQNKRFAVFRSFRVMNFNAVCGFLMLFCAVFIRNVCGFTVLVPPYAPLSADDAILCTSHTAQQYVAQYPDISV